MTSLLIRTLQRILPQSLWLAIRQRPIIQDHQRVPDSGIGLLGTHHRTVGAR